MNSTRWVLSAAIVSLLVAPACKKESSADQPAPAAALPAEPAAVPSDPTPVAPDRPEPSPPEEEMGGIMGDAVGEKSAPAPTANGKKDMVAIGASGKAAVVATARKTIADTESYTASLAAPGKLARGAKGTATLQIVPKSGWHLNDEFPYKLTVVPPAGTKVARPEQGKKDTVSFSPQAMKWNVDFQADSAGAKAFTGVLKFAVCTDTSCDPKKEKLAWNVDVE